MGVGLESFWGLTPRLFECIAEGYRLRKRELETEMYIQGRYIFDAVTIALANGFRKKGTQPTPWLEEPYKLVPLSAEEEKERAEKDREKAIAFFTAWANGAVQDETVESEVR